MEKDGEKIYKIYKPKKQYEISHLLEGIIAIDNNSDSKLIIEKLDEIKKGTDTIININFILWLLLLTFVLVLGVVAVSDMYVSAK